VNSLADKINVVGVLLTAHGLLQTVSSLNEITGRW
jgi:hypothetical protein